MADLDGRPALGMPLLIEEVVGIDLSPIALALPYP